MVATSMLDAAEPCNALFSVGVPVLPDLSTRSAMTHLLHRLQGRHGRGKTNSSQHRFGLIKSCHVKLGFLGQVSVGARMQRRGHWPPTGVLCLGHMGCSWALESSMGQGSSGTVASVHFGPCVLIPGCHSEVAHLMQGFFVHIYKE